MNRQHQLIIVLSLVVLILSAVLVNMGSAKPEHYVQLFSSMSPAEVASQFAQPQCKAAVDAYCPLAAQSQRVMNGVSLVPQLAAVQNACGSGFPVQQACGEQVPNWALLRGGIQNKPTTFA